jgi:hypothetical protein
MYRPADAAQVELESGGELVSRMVASAAGEYLVDCPAARRRRSSSAPAGLALRHQGDLDQGSITNGSSTVERELALGNALTAFITIRPNWLPAAHHLRPWSRHTMVRVSCVHATRSVESPMAAAASITCRSCKIVANRGRASRNSAAARSRSPRRDATPSNVSNPGCDGPDASQKLIIESVSTCSAGTRSAMAAT